MNRNYFLFLGHVTLSIGVFTFTKAQDLIFSKYLLKQPKQVVTGSCFSVKWRVNGENTSIIGFFNKSSENMKNLRNKYHKKNIC